LTGRLVQSRALSPNMSQRRTGVPCGCSPVAAPSVTRSAHRTAPGIASSTSRARRSAVAVALRQRSRQAVVSWNADVRSVRRRAGRAAGGQRFVRNAPPVGERCATTGCRRGFGGPLHPWVRASDPSGETVDARKTADHLRAVRGQSPRTRGCEGGHPPPTRRPRARASASASLVGHRLEGDGRGRGRLHAGGAEYRSRQSAARSTADRGTPPRTRRRPAGGCREREVGARLAS
jgi:hypothetical protein